MKNTDESPTIDEDGNTLISFNGVPYERAHQKENRCLKGRTVRAAPFHYEWFESLTAKQPLHGGVGQKVVEWKNMSEKALLGSHNTVVWVPDQMEKAGVEHG